jgi:hypothetical protein
MGGACGTYGREVRAVFAQRNVKENICTLNYVTRKICWVYSSDPEGMRFRIRGLHACNFQLYS